LTKFRFQLISPAMDFKNTYTRRVALLSVLLVLVTGALTAFVTWTVFAPGASEQRTVRVPGTHVRLGECVTQALRNNPRIGPKIGDTSGQGGLQAVVNQLSDPATRTTRIMYEGYLRLNFTVTLTALGKGMTEARVISFPIFDPAPAVETALRDCTQP
jgi:hypothetical protein